VQRLDATDAARRARRGLRWTSSSQGHHEPLLHVFSLGSEHIATRDGPLKVVGWGTSIGALFASLLGAVSITAEIRHGAIRPTFLATPSREQVIAAELAAGRTERIGGGASTRSADRRHRAPDSASAESTSSSQPATTSSCSPAARPPPACSRYSASAWRDRAPASRRGHRHDRMAPADRDHADRKRPLGRQVRSPAPQPEQSQERCRRKPPPDSSRRRSAGCCSPPMPRSPLAPAAGDISASPCCQHRWSRGTADEMPARRNHQPLAVKHLRAAPGVRYQGVSPKCCLAKSPWLL
jgi:hypothetical protein